MTARRQPKALSESNPASADDSPQPSETSAAVVGAVGGEDSASTQRRNGTHTTTGAGGLSLPPTSTAPSKELSAGADFIGLRIWAESFADAQQHRIALVNRMERGGIDSEPFTGHRQLLDASEHAFKLDMVRAYRRIVRTMFPTVEEWQKSMFGIGEHLLARLLGHLGHPAIATPYAWMDDSPEGHECIPERCGKRHLVALQPFERSLHQLWAYCGHGAPNRRKVGMSQDDALRLGSPHCKMLVHLLAEATMKCQPQPVYESASNAQAVGATDSPPRYNAAASADPAGSPASKMRTTE